MKGKETAATQAEGKQDNYNGWYLLYQISVNDKIKK